MKKAYLIEFTVLGQYLRQLAPLSAFVALCIAVGVGSISATPCMFIVMMGVMGSMSASAYDELNNWGAFRLTMPVTRQDVVLARYAMVIVLIAMSVILSCVLMAVLWIAGQTLPLPDFLAMPATITPEDLRGTILASTICLVAAALISGLTIPAYFKFGNTKAVQFSPFILMILMLGAGQGIGWLSDAQPELIDTFVVWLTAPQNMVTVGAVAVATALIIWAISAIVSLKLYESRDL